MSLTILPYSKEYIVVFATRDDVGLQSTIANKIANSVSSKRERPLCKAVIPPTATNAERLKLSERSVDRNFVLDNALGLKAENKNAPKPFTHLGILYKSVNRIGSVHTAGFVIVRAVERDFYVNVICAEQHDKSKNSPRFGSLLMQKTIDYARTHGFRTMSLSALDHVKDFYVRFNFKAGDGDPCSREWKAKRIKARSAGYRFRKCLVDAEEANFVPASQVRNSYRLPAKTQGRATTELTKGANNGARTASMMAQAAATGVNTSNNNNNNVTSKAFHPSASKVCTLIQKFLDGNENRYDVTLKTGGTSVHIEAKKTQAEFTVEVILWKGDKTPRGLSYKYDSRQPPGSLRETKPGVLGKFYWLAAVGPCITEQAERWRASASSNRRAQASANRRAQASSNRRAQASANRRAQASANRRAQASANRRAQASANRANVINLVSSNDEIGPPAAQRRAANRQAAARMAVVQAAMLMAARPMFMAARPPTRPTGRPSTLAAADYAAINDLFAAHPELK
jgi:hypothetical protein